MSESEMSRVMPLRQADGQSMTIEASAQERAALPGAAAAPAVRERAVQMLVKLEHRRRRRRRLFSLLRRRAPLLRPSLRRVFVRGKPPQRVVRARGELLDDRQRL